MDKQIITFSANQQHLHKTGGLDIFATKTVSYIEAHFDLGENWSGFNSVEAVWWNDYVRPVRTVLDTEGVCVVPTEVLLRKSVVYVNLVGVIASGNTLTDRLTTHPITALTNKFNAQLGEGTTTPLTPSEYEQFVATVKADADRAETAKDSTRGYAESASASASSASASASNASTSATNAHTSEVNAKASEDNAKISELNAEAYKNQAQASAESASASAESAGNSATQAESAKDDAEDARDEIRSMRAEATTLPAGSSATASYSGGLLSLGIPKGDKGDKGNTGDTGAPAGFGTVSATVDANIGTPSVEVTASGADTAKNFDFAFHNLKGEKGDKGDTGEVTMSQLSALLPTDTASGSIASFPDGTDLFSALSVKAQIEPIQDLHGYEKPWSGGNGANKWDEEWETYGSSQIKSKNLIPLIAGATYYLKVPAGIGGTIYFKEDVDIPSSSSWSGANETFTVPSNIHYGIFYAGSGYGTTYNHDIAINYPSSVTTYSPYSNICPISGHTECVTSVSGVNVWDEEWRNGYYKQADGTFVSHSNYVACKNLIPIKPNTKYYFTAGVIHQVLWYDVEGNFISAHTSLNIPKEYTSPNNAYYMAFYVGGSYGGTYNHDISINYPSTDHDYHAYQGDTYTTDLGQTVYGGTVDLVSGLLTVDRAMVDLGIATWYYVSAQDCFYTYKVREYTKQSPNLVCSNYPYVGIYADLVDKSCGYIYGNAICIRDSSFNQDASAFKTAMNGVQLVYELATPQTYQLTPTEVDLLLGQNNLWTDCGAVEVTYKADVGLYIDKKLSNSGTRSLSMGLTKSATVEAETEAEPSKVEVENKTEETKTEPSKTETDKTDTETR